LVAREQSEEGINWDAAIGFNLFGGSSVDKKSLIVWSAMA
jgi:hypothetical protein